MGISRFGKFDGMSARQFMVVPNDMKPAEFAHANYRVTPTPSTTLDDLLSVSAFTHVARTLRRGDMIDALAADGTWYLKVVVLRVESLEVQVGIVEKVKFGKAQPRPAESVPAQHLPGATASATSVA